MFAENQYLHTEVLWGSLGAITHAQEQTHLKAQVGPETGEKSPSSFHVVMSMQLNFPVAHFLAFH